jgi:polyphosphate kinase
MIRVSGLMEQAESPMPELSPDGLSPREQLALIRQRVLDQLQRAHELFHRELLPRLAQAGIRIHNYSDLDAAQQEALRAYFTRIVYPILTPLAVDPGHPFPHISNLSINLAVVIQDLAGVERFARVKIPQVLPRLVPVPPAAHLHSAPRGHDFVWLEQVVAAHLDTLFRGMKVLQSFPFRVIRDADLEIRADEAADLLQTIEESLAQRRFGSVTRLTVTRDMPEHVQALLIRNLEIERGDVYPVMDVLGLVDLQALYDLDLPHLKDPPFRHRIPAPLRPGGDLFAAIRARDILLHHPYDSFAPIVELLRAAAADPDVLAIKQTIYRVGKRSPVIAALTDAADNGKQVAAIVELKARFDEEHNIVWARALEDAGVHVVYGDPRLKTHCKVLLIVRKEADGIRRYVHLSSGNYNVRTASLYTDLGLFTCDPVLAEDVSALFNVLTGYSVNSGYAKLLVSPAGIRAGIIERIEREIAHARAGRCGHVIFKINSLTDVPCIDALYRASAAGVKVDLIVRGACCLVPSVPGLSDHIRVISVVGRFLEHSRIYYYRNGGDGQEEAWVGSADLMRRNLDHRVEVLFPVEDPTAKGRLIRDILLPYLRDNVRARVQQPDGTYARLRPAPGEAPFCVQEYFLPHESEHPVAAPESMPREDD